jgi:hypothetical protein
MQINELAWNLFILMVPGVLSTLMLRHVSRSRNYPAFEFIMYSFLLGLANYIVMELCVSLYNAILGLFSDAYTPKWGLNLSVWNVIYGVKNTKVNGLEMLICYLISIPVGFVLGIIIRKKIILKLFKKAKATNRYGDDDVWTYYFNELKTEWVFIRDINRDIIYKGRVIAYSDSDEKREILLESVSVFKDSEHTVNPILKYKIDNIYLEIEKLNYVIETIK